MSNITLNSRSVRTLADGIHKAFPQFSKPQILEVIAHAVGMRDFNTLSGLLKKSDDAPAAPQAEGTSVPDPNALGLTGILVECYPVSEYGEGPNWALLKLDQAFLAQITKLQKLVVSQDLRFVAVDIDVADYDNDAEDDSAWNCHDWDLYVSQDRFWLRTLPKHAEIACESRAILFRDLAKLLDPKKPAKARGESFRRIGGLLVKDGSDAQALYDMTHTAEEVDVQKIVDFMRDLASDHGFNGFKIDEDSVRDNVEDALGILRLDLTEEQIVQACDEVLEALNG